MKFVQPTDLTTGRPLKVLLLYAVPMLISMFFQQAYNLVDSWVAGNYIGAEALGAVGTCYPVTVFFVAIASGLSLGTSLLCSQRFGAKQMTGVQECITSSLIFFMPLSAAISAVGAGLCPVIIALLAVPAEAAGITEAYLRIYMFSLPFVFLYNISNGVLTGLGDSRTPLLFLIISSVCNIFLDLIFVAVLSMGAAGLALATLVSQALAGLLVLIVVFQIYARFGKMQQLWSVRTLREILALGVPSMIQHLFMSMGQLSLQSVINRYGLIVMAGYSVSFRINGIVINSLMALSNALSGFIAQNKGAGQMQRIRFGIRISLQAAYGFSAAAVLVLLLFGQSILGFFVQDVIRKKEIVAAGMGFIRVVVPFYLLVCMKIVFDGALRGIGAMKLFMMAAVSDVLIRICFGELFSRWFGINGVWAVWPLAWLGGTMMSVGGYWLYTRREKFHEHI